MHTVDPTVLRVELNLYRVSQVLFDPTDKSHVDRSYGRV